MKIRLSRENFKNFLFLRDEDDQQEEEEKRRHEKCLDVDGKKIPTMVAAVKHILAIHDEKGLHSIHRMLHKRVSR